jgi:hypothetical protein
MFYGAFSVCFDFFVIGIIIIMIVIIIIISGVGLSPLGTAASSGQSSIDDR